jgi:hypothetical protein
LDVKWPEFYANLSENDRANYLKGVWSNNLPTQARVSELHQQARNLGVNIPEGQGLTAANIQAHIDGHSRAGNQQVALEDLHNYIGAIGGQDDADINLNSLLKQRMVLKDGHGIDNFPQNIEALNAEYINGSLDLPATIAKLRQEAKTEAAKTDNNGRDASLNGLADKLQAYHDASQAVEPNRLQQFKDLHTQIATHEAQTEHLGLEQQLAVAHGHEKQAERLASLTARIQELEETIATAHNDGVQAKDEQSELQQLQAQQQELTTQLLPQAFSYAQEATDQATQQNAQLVATAAQHEQTVSKLTSENQQLKTDNDDYWGQLQTLQLNQQQLNSPKAAAETRTGKYNGLWDIMKSNPIVSTVTTGAIGVLSLTGLISLFNWLTGSGKTTERTIIRVSGNQASGIGA